MPIDKSQIKSHIFVNAFARLHMGFLDLSGERERTFGSLGLGLNAPDTYIELALGENVFNQTEEKYVSTIKQAILAYANINQEISICVHRAIPRHFGLGSGTQMALAIGAGVNQLFDLNLTLDEIASITGRGMRSGIGIGTFSSGGLVLDGGRGKKKQVPPIIAQHPFPKAWRVLLMFDHGHVGMHGEEEVEAFANLQGADLRQTQKVCHQVLMQALPALKEQDLNAFGHAVASLQAYTGDYFAPAQGGRYASQPVAEVLNYLSDNDVTCVGQSSWGPTGFAVLENDKSAAHYLEKLKSTFQHHGLTWLICEASNMGASVNAGSNP